MKLPVLARQRLCTLLRLNPETAEHVSSPDDLDRLPKPQLLAMAKELKIDVKKIVRETMKSGAGLEAIYEPDELDQWRHSERWPGFAGVFEFEITFKMLGKRWTRQMRANYTFTPTWEYFDLKKQALHTGWGGASFGLSIETQPEPGEYEVYARGRSKRVKPGWLRMEDFTKDDVIPGEVWDRLDEAIDKRCRAEDAERRRIAATGQKVTCKAWSAAARRRESMI